MASNEVRISYALSVTAPGKISISSPDAAKSLKLVATVKQESSPYPDRAITLLTTNTELDPGAPDCPDAFFRKRLVSPTDVNDADNRIYMYPFQYRITLGPIGGVRDMHQRSDHNLITIPPMGQGSVDVDWSLAPERLFRFYKEEGSLEKQLGKFKPGQQFEIRPGNTQSTWWTWGSLDGDLKDKKFSCWSLPGDLPIVREPGQDEGDQIDRNLFDIVDRKDVGMIIHQWNLPGTPDPGDDEPPKVREMRAEGWVFGEPLGALKLECTQTTTFEFVE